MSRLLTAVALRPRLTLTVVLLLSLVAAYECRALRIDNSTERIMVGKDDPDRVYNDAMREVFGGDEVLFVLISGDDAFTPDGMARLAATRRALRRVQGVERVVSLDDVRVVSGSAEAVEVRPLVPPGTADPARLREAMQRAREYPLIRGDLLSTDGDVAAVLVFVRAHLEDPDFKLALVNDVGRIVRAEWGGAFELGGAPYAQVQLNAYTRRDLRRLFPYSFLIMALLLFLYFRTWVGVVLPLLTVVLALIWTAGAMSAAGRSLSLVTTALPPMLLAVGTSYAVRVLCEVEAQLTRSRDPQRVMGETIREVGLTVVLCGVTTMMGFGALMTSRVQVIAELGVFATLGTLASTVIALTLVPATLVICGLPSPGGDRWTIAASLARLMPRLHRVTTERAAGIAIACVLVAVVASIGNLFLRVDQDPYGWFPAASEVAHSTATIDRALSGATPFNIVFESAAGTIADPTLVRFMDRVEAFIQRQPEVGKATSFADHLRIMHAAMLAGANAEALPATSGLIAQYHLLYTFGDDPDTLNRYVDEAGGRYNLMVRAFRAPGQGLQALVDRIDAFITATAPPGVHAHVTGTGLVRLKTNAEFTRGLVSNIALASGMIGALMIVALRSVPLGLLALIPNLIPIIALYGVLGWLGLSLNAATVITGTVAIGNAVDDTVQYLDRYRRRLRELGDRVESRRATLAAVGNPMILSDVILLVGFAVLMASNFIPVATLGLLGAIAMLASLLANLFLVPALLALGDEKQASATTPPSLR